MNGQDGRQAGEERQRVLEVGEPRPEPPDEPRQPPRHAPLLRAGVKLDRLDTVRNEVRVPRDGRKAEIRSHVRQLPEQIGDVGLVAGPLAAEDVGVQEHVDHAAASR